MIVDSQKKFERAIATAMNADSQIYDSMETYLLSADVWFRETFLGTTLYDNVGTMPESLLRQLELIVSLRAFSEGIPFIDLILTPTGFGVVSNQNVAPASKERVERLQKQAVAVMEDAIDLLILELNVSDFREQWAQGVPHAEITSQLFWVASELQQYAGMPYASRAKLRELRPAIAAAQQQIATYISRDYLNNLLLKRRKNALQEDEACFIEFIKKVAGLILQGMQPVAEGELKHLVNVMVANPERFTVYLASEEYKLKTMTPYENKKKDSVFFFG